MFHNHAYKAKDFTSLLRKRTSLPSPTEQRRCDLNAIQLYVAVSIKLITEPVRGESNPIHRKCQPFITTSGVIPILIATTI